MENNRWSVGKCFPSGSLGCGELGFVAFANNHSVNIPPSLFQATNMKCGIWKKYTKSAPKPM